MKTPLLSSVKQTCILQQKSSCYFQILLTLYMSKLVVKIDLLTAGISAEKNPIQCRFHTGHNDFLAFTILTSWLKILALDKSELEVRV